MALKFPKIYNCNIKNYIWLKFDLTLNHFHCITKNLYWIQSFSLDILKCELRQMPQNSAYRSKNCNINKHSSRSNLSRPHSLLRSATASTHANVNLKLLTLNKILYKASNTCNVLALPAVYAQFPFTRCVNSNSTQPLVGENYLFKIFTHSSSTVLILFSRFAL